MRGNFFARNDLVSLLPLPNHDENVTAFDANIVYINREWRRFIVAWLTILQERNQDILDDATQDEFNRVYDNFLYDFYTYD